MQAQPPAPPKTKAVRAMANRPITLDETDLRLAIFDSAARFAGKTERTNHNDADWIYAINRFSNLPRQSHYCASGFYYVHVMNGVRLPIKGVGMVRSYFNTTSRVIYRRNARGNQRIGPRPRRMDAVSLFYSHIEGLADDRFDPDTDDRVRLIGFNTTGGKGTLGGCYINTRRTSEIKVIANWISPYLQTIR